LQKLLALALGLALALSYSCKKKDEPGRSASVESPAPGSTSQAQGLGPETYYNFKLDVLALDNEVSSNYLALLANAAKYDSGLEGRISDLEKDSVDKYKALRTKYHIPFSDLGRMESEPQARSSLADYLAQHPEVRNRLLELEQTSQKLNAEVNKEENRLHPQPLPPVPAQAGTTAVQPLPSASAEKPQ